MLQISNFGNPYRTAASESHSNRSQNWGEILYLKRLDVMQVGSMRIKPPNNQGPRSQGNSIIEYAPPSYNIFIIYWYFQYVVNASKCMAHRRLRPYPSHSHVNLKRILNHHIWIKSTGEMRNICMTRTIAGLSRDRLQSTNCKGHRYYKNYKKKNRDK